MPLTLELFFTPNWITWNAPRDDPKFVGTNPRRQREITLAANPLVEGDPVFIGSSMRAMQGNHAASGHYIQLPKDGGLSAKAVTIYWDPAEGLVMSSGSKNPLLLRAWGNMQEIPLGGVNAKAASAERFENEIVFGDELRVVGRLPGEGAWFRITPSASFDDDWHRPAEEGATEDNAIARPREDVKRFFFCDRFPDSAEHVLWGNPEDCGESAHNDRADALAYVLGHYAPYFTWPPRGWFLPIEPDVVSLERVKAVRPKNVNASKWRDRVLRDLVDAGIPYVTEDDLPDRLVKAGVLTWKTIHDALDQMLMEVPLDWVNPPSKYKHWCISDAVVKVDYDFVPRR